MADETGSVVAGALWMLVLSILLFWLPFFGPLIAGVVGGKSAGGVGSGILAALLPAVVVGVLLFFFGTALTALPIVGAIFAAVGFFMMVALAIGPLLLGAIIGGLLA